MVLIVFLHLGMPLYTLVCPLIVTPTPYMVLSRTCPYKVIIVTLKGLSLEGVLFTRGCPIASHSLGGRPIR